MIILAFSDVFGPMSGKHREICDEMATAIPGSLVCLPDLFDGEPICPDFLDSKFPGLRLKLFFPKMLYRIRYRYGWAKLGPKIQALVDSFSSSSIPMCTFGFCFGGYLAVKASSIGSFRGAVGFHPSLIVGRLQCSPHSEKDADLAKAVRCPQLMIPAQNDDASVKPGGEFINLVATAYPLSKSVCFENMVHGWMTRGADDPLLPQPAGVESVRESQVSALKLAVEFFEQVAQPVS